MFCIFVDMYIFICRVTLQGGKSVESVHWLVGLQDFGVRLLS